MRAGVSYAAGGFDTFGLADFYLAGSRERTREGEGVRRWAVDAQVIQAVFGLHDIGAVARRDPP